MLDLCEVSVGVVEEEAVIFPMESIGGDDKAYVCLSVNRFTGLPSNNKSYLFLVSPLSSCAARGATRATTVPPPAVAEELNPHDDDA